MGCRYARIDWAADKHDVLVADEAGAALLSATFAHDEKGLSSLCRTLVRLEVGLIAIERPDGLLVERLLDAGLRVLALHPNKVAAARDRFRVSGGKSDRFDAFVLCELARTDHHRFRVLEPDSDRTKAIWALTRAREDLVAARTGIVNQLRAELARFWPGPLTLFSHMDAEILLAFLERYPSPADAHGLGVARMQAFLERERYSGGQHPTALMAKLRSAPRARIGELELAARRRLVLSFVAMVRTLNAQIKDLEREIRAQVRAHPDGSIFLSLFKSPASVITAAELLAEIGDCRERYPDRDTLAADAGQAAVAQESGKWKTARFRRACNTRRVLPAGRQQPPLAPLGPDPLCPSPPARSRAPARDPDRRPRLVPCRVAMLAQPHPIRPRATSRPATPHHRHHPDRDRPLVDQAATKQLAEPGLWRADLATATPTT
jgi:transposase